MDRLGNGPARSKAKLRGAEAMIKMCCQSFLQEGGIDFIHGVSKRDRSIVRKELCIFLIVFNKHNHFGV